MLAGASQTSSFFSRLQVNALTLPGACNTYPHVIRLLANTSDFLSIHCVMERAIRSLPLWLRTGKAYELYILFCFHILGSAKLLCPSVKYPVGGHFQHDKLAVSARLSFLPFPPLF